MIWAQHYDPLGNATASTLVAALPVVVLLGLVALGRIRTWLAAVLGLGAAAAVAAFAFRMPPSATLGAAVHGAAFGLFPIGWIVLNVMFLHALTVKSGRFDALRGQLARLAPDPRLQLILVAYCFGGFIEGSAGFGAPVAITAAMLMQLGFKPIEASALTLIANTAPVAFGSVGIPITTLAQVTGLDVFKLSQMAGRQLPLFSLVVPFWLVWAWGGFRAVRGVWPAALVAGLSFSVVQALVSNLHGPLLVDTAAGLASIAAFMGLLRVWKPRDVPAPRAGDGATDPKPVPAAMASPRPGNPWTPWIILALVLFAWGLPPVKQAMDRLGVPTFAVPGIHARVVRVPPVVEMPTPGKPTKPEAAEFKANWLSASGTGILVAALLSAAVLGFRPRELAAIYLETLRRVRPSLLTIAAMIALGNVTKYSGADATLGLALANTGSWYPFFGTLLGWLGVALTGSDTASNVLFGSLQRITATQLGLSPYLMAAANSVGGVMGKMIDAQSIVVASVATGIHGAEGRILRRVFFHSLALAVLVGIYVSLQARWPFLARMVVH